MHSAATLLQQGAEEAFHPDQASFSNNIPTIIADAQNATGNEVRSPSACYNSSAELGFVASKPMILFPVRVGPGQFDWDAAMGLLIVCGISVGGWALVWIALSSLLLNR